MNKAVVGLSYPVVGTLHRNVLASLYPEIDAGFLEYDTPTVRGLANVEGLRLDLLAITAKVEGRGDCARFLQACMDAYETVAVWVVGNSLLESMLRRRGFTDTQDDNGETGLIWTRP